MPRNTSRKTGLLRAKSPRMLPFEPLESRVLLAATIFNPLTLGGLGDDTGIASMSVGPGPNPITYVTGSFSGSITISRNGANDVTLSSVGGTDVFLIAIQANTVLWARSFGGTGDDTGSGVVFANNSVYVVGSFNGTIDADPGASTRILVSQGFTDAFLSRFDAAGNFQSALSFGGPGIDSANRIKADGSGNLYMMGVFSGTADLDPGAGVTNRTSSNQLGDVFLSKVTAAGDLVWVNRFTSDDTLLAANLAVSSDGIVSFAGTFRGNADLNGSEGGISLVSSTVDEGFVEKLTAGGALDWKAVFGLPTDNLGSALQVNDMTMDASGNLIIGGQFNGTVDLDPSSFTHTVTTFPALSNASGNDAFFGFALKLDTTGNYVWSGAFIGAAASTVYGVATDAAGNVYITGDFISTMDADFLGGTHIIVAPTGAARSAFVTRYDSSGRLVAESHPRLAAGDSHGILIAARADIGVFIGGTFFNTVTFTSDDGSNHVLVSHGGLDNFVMQINPFNLAPTVTLQSSQTQVFPRQDFTLTATILGATSGTVTFTDSTGQIIFESVPLNSNGTATFTTVFSAEGSLGFRAAFDDGINPAVSSAIVTVTAAFPDFPLGNIDSATGGIVQGWAADLEENTTPLVVQILIDGISRGAVVANQSRPDLVKLVGNADHGFSFLLPPLTGGTHVVTAVTFDPADGAGRVIGTTNVSIGSLYFDEAYYRANNPDVAAAIAAGQLTSGYEHFILIGAHEGRNPNAFFNELWYRANNPDVAAAVANGSIPSGYYQFVNSGTHEGRDPSPLFNEEFYRRANPDVAAAISAGTLFSGYTHFLEAGLYEGRAATPWFNDAEYRAANPDIAAALAAGTLQASYLQFATAGIAEDRAPSHLYVESAYLTLNPDVGSAVASDSLPSGLDHFINTGFFEGRVSDPTFDTAFYLSTYPEVNGLIANGTVKSAFQHYLLFGQLEGFAEHA